jgi:hypothetical protein
MRLRSARKYLGLGVLVVLLSFRSPQLGSQQCEPGCDPDGSQEQQCIDRGWEWDSEACECREPEGCSAEEEDACRSGGGIWDDIDCECESCQIHSELLYTDSEQETTCESDGSGNYWLTCTYETEYWQDYCQDGSEHGDSYAVSVGTDCTWGDSCDC